MRRQISTSLLIGKVDEVMGGAALGMPVSFPSRVEDKVTDLSGALFYFLTGILPPLDAPFEMFHISVAQGFRCFSSVFPGGA